MTKKTSTWAVVALCIAGVAAACTSDKKETPSIVVNEGGDAGATSGGTSAKGGATSIGGTDAAGGDTTAAGATAVATGGSATGTAGAASVAGAANLAGAAGAGTDCEDATKKCYRCAATTDNQILRHCTDATCIPFDNSTLTKMVGGKLPALP